MRRMLDTNRQRRFFGWQRERVTEPMFAIDTHRLTFHRYARILDGAAANRDRLARVEAGRWRELDAGGRRSIVELDLAHGGFRVHLRVARSRHKQHVPTVRQSG